MIGRRCFIFIIGLFFPCSKGSATLQVPSAGNCEEDTFLTCQVSGSFKYTGWEGLGRTIISYGVVIRQEDQSKYTETRGTSSFTLTIHNTGISDEGDYKCLYDFGTSSTKRLNIECKASPARHSLHVTNGKKVQITVNKLYPASPTLTATFTKETSAIQLPGSLTCSGSTQYSGYYRCVWSYSYSLNDGLYTYSLNIKTITQASPLTGSFKIVSPESPSVADIVKVNTSYEAIYGTEGQSLTIQCTSKGGYPVPTVTWYKNSIFNSNQLATTSSGTLQSDGTYTVTLQHTFTPSVTDDRRNFICRSYYPQADSAHKGSSSKAVPLYLTLKPSMPTVTQMSVVSSGNVVTVRCRTTGCRPAASISWLYQGIKYNGSTTTTQNVTTDTFSVESTFTRQVTAVDNGQSIRCIITHPALVNPKELTKSINLNVQFRPSTTLITGNKEIIATGSTALALICTTGSSNPESNIIWKNGSQIIENDLSYTQSSGQNNGIVRSQELLLYPTRYMDGNVIVCSVSNTVSESPVVDKINLNLKYSPIVSIQGEHHYTLDEGTNKQFICKVEGKPTSTIKWYHGNSLLTQRTSNIFNLSLSPVNRSNYGNYSCKAQNKIGTEQQDQISINVRFKPLSTIITGNNNIIANGGTKLSLDCISGSSNPISDLIWKINSVITGATQNLSDQNGDYGGTKCRQRLTLTPTRDNDGDIISCEAKNTLGTSSIHEQKLDLRYRPIIDPMSGVIVVEGNYSVLLCSASSKPVSTLKWFRQGQSFNIHDRGTETMENNKLTYRIDKVIRSDAATYTCKANNGIENADNKDVVLTVYYPPNVTATTTNTTVQAPAAVITCKSHGVPNFNYKYGKWKHYWPGYEFTLSETKGSEKLELTNLTYEHSGIYTCSASNGVKVFGSDKEFMEGSVHLVIKSYPIIINITRKTSARLMENATVNIYYFSNAANDDVKIYKNGTRQENVKYSVIKTNSQVDLKVFTHAIKTEGVKAEIFVKISSKEDIGFYDVIVSNEINSTILSVEIVVKGPPEIPFNLKVDNIKYNEARLSWRRAYHGGFPQTFIIQLSTDGKSWKDTEMVFDEKNESEEIISKVLSGLSPSTTYFVRIFSMNQEGNSTITDSLNYTTSSKIDLPGSYNAVIGVLVGGIVTACVLILGIVFIIFVLRRKLLRKGRYRSRLLYLLSCLGKPDDGTSNLSEMREGSMHSMQNTYEQLQRQSDTKTVYEKLNAVTDLSSNTNSPYESLQKKPSAKAIPAAATVRKEDQLYENLKIM